MSTSAWPVMPGVPAAGVISGGARHPGPAGRVRQVRATAVAPQLTVLRRLWLAGVDGEVRWKLHHETRPVT